MVKDLLTHYSVLPGFRNRTPRKDGTVWTGKHRVLERHIRGSPMGATVGHVYQSEILDLDTGESTWIFPSTEIIYFRDSEGRYTFQGTGRLKSEDYEGRSKVVGMHYEHTTLPDLLSKWK